MRKTIITCLAMAIAASSCTLKEKQYAKIEGTMENDAIYQIFLTRIDSVFSIVDSSRIIDGRFAFNYKLDKPDIYELYAKNGNYRTHIALEPGCKMKVTVEKNNATTVDVIRGEEEKSRQQLISALKEYSEAMDDVSPDEDTDLKSIVNKRNEKEVSEILKHPRTLAAIFALSSMIGVENDLFFDVYESAVDTATYAHSYYFRRIQNEYRTRKSKILVGNTAFDFDARTIDGERFILSQLRGKYIVLNFWASWCKPCREKNREIADYLTESENKELIFVSFNVDDKRTTWETASRDDKITWFNVSNGEGFDENSVLSRYKVTQMPSIFLISPEGVILAQNRPLGEMISLK